MKPRLCYSKIFWSLFALLLLSESLFSQDGYEVMPKGSYVINQGITPQTHANALKPYGLIYQLLKEHPIAIKWAINPDKQKDGVDFVMGEEEIRSGAFIIPTSYITEEVEEVISSWRKRGVNGKYLHEDLRIPVFTTLSIAPRWTLDKENGRIALAFFKNAGIPPSAYGGLDPNNWKFPSQLDICDDIFVMPHAQPSFETHKNLYRWNREFKGAIWAGCNAGSQLENLYGEMLLNGKMKLIQLNFLSAGTAGARTTGLVPHYEHRYATPPYEHRLPSDPVSQYLGKSDNAYLNGSERILYPKKANIWRNGTKKIIIDPTAPDVPALSHGPGCIVVYGHGFDDPGNGLVMYQVSHDFSGKSQASIAAMRTFFNWSFYAAEVKRKENIIQFQNQKRDKIFAARVGDDLLKKLNLDPILFDLDKAEIKTESARQLDQISEYMKEYPELLIDIRSHTDSRADDDYNIALSNRRVNVTIDYLIEKGIAPDRISGRGYGETELVNNCRNGVPCSEDQHRQNRRSEFILSINCDIYTGRLKL